MGRLPSISLGWMGSNSYQFAASNFNGHFKSGWTSQQQVTASIVYNTIQTPNVNLLMLWKTPRP